MNNKKHTGTVFDIQRTAFNDGPGVRTVFFLKGCPLRCIWCHNPESLSPKTELAWYEHKCSGCRKCEEVCPVGVHSFDNGKHLIDRTRCTLCGACAKACISSALKLCGKSMTTEEVHAEGLKDRKYYEASGGGITLSGGEPLVQIDFVEEILRCFQRDEIHTCIDTCGHISPESFERAVVLADCFLFDYKATDQELHRRLTGVDNRLILKNLERLLTSGKEVILRCPLIPRINDQKEHLQEIARLKNHPNIKLVEIMKYHNIGNPKYSRYGFYNPLPGLNTATNRELLSWNKIIDESIYFQ